MNEEVCLCPRCGGQPKVWRVFGRNPNRPIGYKIKCDCGNESFLSKRRGVLVHEWNKYSCSTDRDLVEDRGWVY